MCDLLNKTNIATTISTLLSSTKIKDIWIDNEHSWFRIVGDNMVVPVNYKSISGWYDVSTGLIDTTTTNIKIDIKSNTNTALNRGVITLKYTYK